MSDKPSIIIIIIIIRLMPFTPMSMHVFIVDSQVYAALGILSNAVECDWLITNNQVVMRNS